METYIDDSIDLIKLAYTTLQSRSPNEKIYVAYSGGKDSECIAQLCFDTLPLDHIEISYNATGIDPPEVVRHIREQFRLWESWGVECHFNPPKVTMHDLIVKKGPPTRWRRYCCAYYKENAGNGRVTLTGVRWAESPRRRENHGKATLFSKNKDKRKFYNNDNDIEREIMEQCTTKNKLTVNPIIHWTDDEVWDYIRLRDINYCKLYDEGFKRLGCVGCPMASTKNRLIDFERWPHVERYFKKALVAFMEAKPEACERCNWHTLDDLWNWWLEIKEETEEEKQRRLYKQERDKAIIDMRNDGKTYKEIRETLGIGNSTIQRIIELDESNI